MEVRQLHCFAPLLPGSDRVGTAQFAIFVVLATCVEDLGIKPGRGSKQHVERRHFKIFHFAGGQLLKNSRNHSE